MIRRKIREDGQKPLIEMLDNWIMELENVDFHPKHE